MQVLRIVIPVYRDDGPLSDLLDALQTQLWPGDWVLVDGACADSTRDIAQANGVHYLESVPGRGQQIALGVEAQLEPDCRSSQSDWIFILHADSGVTPELKLAIEQIVDGPPCWGRFDVAIDGLGLIATSMNLRSRMTKICTGDQGMFFHRSLVESLPRQPLMEDIELSKQLKRRHPAKFVPRAETIQTSPRRWRERGVVRTVLAMWFLRMRYFFGVRPTRLYTEYYGRDD